MTASRDYPGTLDLSLDPRLIAYEVLEDKRALAERLLKTFSWKSSLKPGFPIMISLMGGTGTGKSTLFNSFAGAIISNVGIRRPWTLKAVLLVHEDSLEELRRGGQPAIEQLTEAEIVTHKDPQLRRIILVDTPDFDSVEVANRSIADDYFVLSDIIVFVTSQEKYADLKGLQMWRRAWEWGKRTFFILNKTESPEAYDDFCQELSQLGFEGAPVQVECVESFPHHIPGLRDRPGLNAIFSSYASEPEAEDLRTSELNLLARHTVEALEDLEQSLAGERDRLFAVQSAIEAILATVTEKMEARLSEVLTQDLQDRIRIRLQDLLRKYDFLFVPRMKLRNAIRGLFHTVAGVFFPSVPADTGASSEEEARIGDLHDTLAAAQLRPLEAAVSDFNFRMAELLALDPGREDFRQVALDCVPRWGAEEIRSQYQEAFPGLENLLEDEFNRLRDGLSRLDELKLYGTNTLWAVLLVTAEVVVGGGFTLLDALFDSVVFPFIPKWMLNVQVRDSLREIARRVEREHRRVMRGILRRQAELYMKAFAELLPDEETFERLKELKVNMPQSR